MLNEHRVPGVQCIYAGAAIDATDTLVIAVVWDDHASSIEFVKSQRFESYFDKLNAVSDEPASTTHCYVVQPREQLAKLFSAPAIEMAPIKVKGDKVHQHYRNFERAGKMIAQANGYVAQFQEPQIESPCVPSDHCEKVV